MHFDKARVCILHSSTSDVHLYKKATQKSIFLKNTSNNVVMYSSAMRKGPCTTRTPQEIGIGSKMDMEAWKVQALPDAFDMRELDTARWVLLMVQKRWKFCISVDWHLFQ